jgi:predicted DNA binding CopG/RHH family protein
MKKNLKLPKFKNEDQERKYWSKIDLSKHFDPSDFEEIIFPNLKPTTHAISIRIPDYLLNSMREKANELQIPYQSLIKIFIQKGLAAE